MAWWDNNNEQPDAVKPEETQVPDVTPEDDGAGETADADIPSEETAATESEPEVAAEPEAAADTDGAGEAENNAEGTEAAHHRKSDSKRARSGKDKAKNTRKPMTGDMVSFVRTVSDAIEYKDMMPAVKALLDTNTNNVNELIAMLTEPKSRDKVNAIIRRINDIAAAGERERMMIVALSIQADPAGAKTLFSVLNALAPDRGFGRSSGDAQKDARTIDDKWGDGVDATSLKSFLY